MHRFVTLFFIAIVAAIGLSFGGMAFMAHGSDMMATSTCMLGACSDSHAGQMGGMDCVSHCLKATSDLGSIPMTGTMQISLILFAVATIFFSVFRNQLTQTLFRSDQAIARLLLHRQLATVIIRD